MMHSLIFNAVDSWCFREARPMGSTGGTAIKSVFPPPSATLIGAARTMIGNALDVDWQAFAKDKQHPVRQLIGDSENTGALAFGYPRIEVLVEGAFQPLFPAPMHLVSTQEKVYALQFTDELIQCDLGNVQLPNLTSDAIGAKPVEGMFITEASMAKLKQGDLIDVEELIDLNELVASETRLGIARDNHSAKVIEGMLYQTEHLRINSERFEEWRLSLPVSGLPDGLHSRQYIRLGGEGRMAQVAIEPRMPESSPTFEQTEQALLMLTSHADFGGIMPTGFASSQNQNGQTVWRGKFEQIDVEISSICASKPVKQGGWDVLKRQPKPVRPLTPAGTVYMLQCEHMQSLAEWLVTNQLGNQTDFGMGHAMLLPVTSKG